MNRRWHWMVALAVMVTAMTAEATVTTGDERIAATIAALSAGPEAFETYAKDAYASPTLARSTPEQRKTMAQNLRAEFGTMNIKELKRLSPTKVSVRVEGSTGMTGTFTFDHEEAAPFRLTGFGVTVGGGGQDGPPMPPPPVNGRMSGKEIGTGLDAYLEKLVADDRFSGVALVARDGKAFYERAFGQANRSDGVANRTTTRFNIGSINKHFTKTGIFQLVAAGKLTLSDTIGKVLPDYPNADAKKATIEQLLEHQGGLADFFSPEFSQLSRNRFRSNRDWYQYVAPKPVLFEAGTKRQYCNSCYIVLGEMIERVTGMPYEQYIQKNVFDPSGMKSTGFFELDAIVPDVATGYTRRAGPGLRSNLLMTGARGSGAGGAQSNTADLLAFDNALREGKLLNPEMTARFLGGQPSAGRSGAGTGYAGGAPGLNAGVESDATWTVIVLANLDPPAAEALAGAIHRALGAP